VLFILRTDIVDATHGSNVLLLPLVPCPFLFVVGIVLWQLKVGVLSGYGITLVQFEECHKLTVVVFVGDMIKIGLAIEGDVVFPR
jgi:hypothetical protein